MTLYAKARAVQAIAASVVLTLLLVCWPGSAAVADASPMGAPAAVAVIVALIVPVAVGWACSRQDAAVERCGIRPVALFDLLLTLLAVGACLSVLLAVVRVGAAPEALRASRALVVYTGLLLAARPLLGWALASVAPAVYLALVLAAGRGEDDAHPAAWAWIAAPAREPWSWMLTGAVMLLGVVTYLALGNRSASGRDLGDSR